MSEGTAREKVSEEAESKAGKGSEDDYKSTRSRLHQSLFESYSTNVLFGSYYSSFLKFYEKEKLSSPSHPQMY